MIPGKLYISKKLAFHIWEDDSYGKHIGVLNTEVPFILVEFVNLSNSLEDMRILTTDGTVGIIHSINANREFFQEVKE